MRQLMAALLGAALLGAAGFATASVVKTNKHPGAGSTVSSTSTGVTGTTPSRRVTICHHTGSRSNPQHTITVDEHAVPAHMAHGDTVGPCPPTATTTQQATTQAQKSKPKKATPNGKSSTHGKSTTHGKSDTHGKPSNTGKPDNPGNGSGNGNGGGHGNSGGHGRGK